MRRDVDLHRLRHRQHRTLRGGVRDAACQPDLGDAGRHVDDRAGPLLDHVRHDRARHEVHPAHVHSHDPVEKLGLGLDDVADAGDAGIVEQHVDALEPLHDTRRKRDRVLLIGDVDVLRGSHAAGLADRRGGRARAAVVDVRHDDDRAFGCEELRGRLADPRAGAGDDAYLVLQPFHRLTSRAHTGPAG